MEIKHRGENLTREELREIANNFHISFHCRQRLEEKGHVDVKQLILNPMVAYFNTDGSVNIASDRWHYLVAAYSEDYGNWNIITWKNNSWYDQDVYDKQNLAKRGIARKENGN